MDYPSTAGVTRSPARQAIRILAPRRSGLAPRVVLGRLATRASVEEILGAAGFVLVLKLRHAFDQCVELFIGQVRHQRPNSCLEITSQRIKPAIHHRKSVETNNPVATSMPCGAPMIGCTDRVQQLTAGAATG